MRQGATRFVCDAAACTATEVTEGPLPVGWRAFRGHDYCSAHSIEVLIDGQEIPLNGGG